jgi:Asp-tRNA(Asn)/Glu-tRNA(Gln) amidotransferase A subunit family amidase
MPGEPYWAPPAAHSYLQEVTSSPGKLRVGLSLEPPSGVSVDKGCQDAARSTAARCAALGHEVIDVAWPFPAEELAAVQASIIPAHVAAAVDRRLAELGRLLAPDDLEPVTAGMVERGRSVSATAYVNAVAAMHRVGHAMGQLLEDIDVLLTPTLGRLPWSLGLLRGSEPDLFAKEVRSVAAFTMVANVTGQPAMSLPLDHDERGLPVGSHFIGRLGDEGTLYRLAGQLEAAYPWFAEVPTIG